MLELPGSLLGHRMTVTLLDIAHACRTTAQARQRGDVKNYPNSEWLYADVCTPDILAAVFELAAAVELHNDCHEHLEEAIWPKLAAVKAAIADIVA